MFDRFRGILKGTGPREAAPKVAEAALAPAVALFDDSSVETGGASARAPDVVKDNIDHGGHFRALARNDEEAARLCIDALAASRHKKVVVYGGDEVSGYLWGDSLLQVMTIIKNGETLGAFPVFRAGVPRPARVTEIIECQNGYEGQLQVYMEGSVLTFFDTLYFRNKGGYYPGKDVRAIVAGIAYVLARGHAQARSEDDLLVRYEGGDVDDYVFRGTVQGVTDFAVDGWKARAIKTTIKAGPDGKPMDFFICVTPHAMYEKVAPGDRVNGIVWLQGFVLP